MSPLRACVNLSLWGVRRFGVRFGVVVQVGQQVPDELRVEQDGAESVRPLLAPGLPDAVALAPRAEFLGAHRAQPAVGPDLPEQVVPEGNLEFDLAGAQVAQPGPDLLGADGLPLANFREPLAPVDEGAV